MSSIDRQTRQSIIRATHKAVTAFSGQSKAMVAKQVSKALSGFCDVNRVTISENNHRNWVISINGVRLTEMPM